MIRARRLSEDAKTSRILPVLILCFAVLLSPMLMTGVSLAEPNRASLYLLNKSPSMLDFGMLRLGLFLDSIKPESLKDMTDNTKILKGISGYYRAKYDFEMNRVEVVFKGSAKGIDGTPNPKDVCRQLIIATRTLLSVNPETGAPFTGSGSDASSFFMNFGYKNKDQPENLPQEVDKLIWIRVALMQTWIPPIKIDASCIAPLLGSEVLFEQ